MGAALALLGPMTMGVWSFTQETYNEWSEDRAPRMGAALAYYTVFSLAPMLVIAIGVAGIFFGQRTVEGQLMAEIRNLLGPEGADAIRAMIENAARQRSSGVLAAGMGIAALIFGATGAFGELQDALNQIWNVQPKTRGPIGILKHRFLSFTLVVGIGFLLLVSLVISAALTAATTVFGHYVSATMLYGVNFGLSFVVVTALFAMMFKVLPDAKIAWRDVLLGAAVASLLFSIGKFLIGLYLGKSGMASAYGAAGSLVIVLVWVYYTAQILFLGAEFAKVYARRRGRLLEPTENAEVRVPPPPQPRPHYGVALLAAIGGFLLGRTPLRRVAASAPEAAKTAAEVAIAVAAVERLRRARIGKRAA